MPSDRAVGRIEAWHAGRPLPLYRTRHLAISSPQDTLILDFVRMGGESAPWGFAVGQPGTAPTIAVVPEPRKRDLGAELSAKLAPILLKHFRSPGFSTEQVAGPKELLPIRQLWVPNITHIEMLHALAYAYTFARRGEPGRIALLNAFGRVCGWLFRESQRPGQLTVISAARALADAYTFPADAIRQAHLGFLLAWLQTPGARDARLDASAEAEQMSIATSLDPALERDELDGVVKAWNAAERAGDGPEQQRLADVIRSYLEPELLRRFQLVERARSALESDPRRVNAGVELLKVRSREEYWRQYIDFELRKDPETGRPLVILSPETDRNPAAAASAYFAQEAAEDFRISALIDDDEELQQEAVASGDAVRGRIVRVVDEGEGRKSCPVWLVESQHEGPLRIRVGSRLCVAGLRSRTVQVRCVEWTKPSTLQLEVEVTNLKTLPRNRLPGVCAATDPRLRGKEVLLLPDRADFLADKKRYEVWRKDAPGAWLTRASGTGSH